MLCSAFALCCVRPNRGHLSTLCDLVLHASVAPLLFWGRLLLARPDALLGLLLWLGSRRCSCRCNMFAAVLWLGSRFIGGRCNLYALMFVTCIKLSLFCESVFPGVSYE